MRSRPGVWEDQLTVLGLCSSSFTGGYMEASISLPGTPYDQGYWPGPSFLAGEVGMC